MKLLEDALLKKESSATMSPFAHPQQSENQPEGLNVAPPSLQLKAEPSAEEKEGSLTPSSFMGERKEGKQSLQMKENPFQLSEDEGEEIVATEEEENEEEQEREVENEEEDYGPQEGQADEEEDVVGETEEEQENSSLSYEQELQLKLKPGSHGPGCSCDGCTAQMKVRQLKENESASASADMVSSKTKMSENVRQKMEGALGSDFSDVKIHTNSDHADDIGALAFTQGSDIHFSSGEYAPETKSGQELLGHELTHVVQQRQGRVEQTSERQGVPVNDSPSLEQEADQYGRKAANYDDHPERTTLFEDGQQHTDVQNNGNKPAPAQGFFKKAWKKIKKGAKKVVGGVKKGAKKVVGGVKKGLGKAWGGIKRAGGWFKRGLGKVWGGVKKAGKWIGKAGRAIWNGVKWVGGKLWDKMKAIYHRVKFFVKSWPKRMQRWASLVWEGVKSLKPWSISWWKSLGKASTWRKFGFYLFELVLQSAEVLGITDIYETAVDFIKFNTRGLNSHERNIAQGVFGNSIDYDLVRLDLWAVLGPSWSGREYVSMHTINGWGGQITDDTLIHELTHVWQYEKMGAAYMSRALHAQAVQGSSAYDYGGVANLSANSATGLSAFNPEAQGNIIQHYYRLKVNLPVDGASASDLPTYQTYVDELKR